MEAVFGEKKKYKLEVFTCTEEVLLKNSALVVSIQKRSKH